jgi:hypothetical protein
MLSAFNAQGRNAGTTSTRRNCGEGTHIQEYQVASNGSERDPNAIDNRINQAAGHNGASHRNRYIGPAAGRRPVEDGAVLRKTRVYA